MWKHDRPSHFAGYSCTVTQVVAVVSHRGAIAAEQMSGVTIENMHCSLLFGASFCKQYLDQQKLTFDPSGRTYVEKGLGGLLAGHCSFHKLAQLPKILLQIDPKTKQAGA